MTPAPVLGRRALNRALLARQYLLAPAQMSALDLIEHLVGVQAQAPLAPYVGLWSRLVDFNPDDLGALLTSRAAVRATLMRATVHLVSARDCLTMRTLVDPVLRSGFAGHFRNAIAGMDVATVTEVGQRLLRAAPRTHAQIRTLLGARWPASDPDGLAYAVRYLVPNVQVTPRGVWGSSGPAALTTVEAWLGRPLDPSPSIDELVRRYFAAFGPAGVRDAQLWCGLTRLREIVDRLPGLRSFQDEDGRELYDVEDGPLPDPETPAPVRFLPEYDNVLLSHADRRHIIPDGRSVPLPPGNGARVGTVLIDGHYQADWRIGQPAVLTVTAFRPLTKAERTETADEGARLLKFAVPDAGTIDVQIREP
jgi:hypothetical protein